MIHSTPQKGKFKRLVRRVRELMDHPDRISSLSPETATVGLLERLWHTTAINVPRGDIGKMANDEIAEYIGWLGDADLLVDALVGTEWIDRCDVHRLIIHDWHVYAPGFIRAQLKKLGLTFASLERSSEDSLEHSLEHSLDRTPNLTKPDLTKPEKEPASPVSEHGEPRKAAARRSTFVDAAYRDTMRARYPHADISVEYRNMLAWMQERPGLLNQLPTKTRFNNWLKRVRIPKAHSRLTANLAAVEQFLQKNEVL